MKKRKIFLGVITGLMVSLLLTGCKNREAITKDEFITEAQDYGYVIEDNTEEYSFLNSNAESSTIANMNDSYEIKFHVFKDEESAIIRFEIDKSSLENYKEDSLTYSSKSGENYSTCTLVTDDYYMYLSRIGNTLICIDADSTYKKEIKSFISELGY